MGLNVLLLYLIVSFFYILSPGPAVFLAIANGMTAGIKPLIASTVGNVVGLFILSFVSILGLGAIVIASSTLFLVVKIIGAAYLIYLGAKQIRQSKRHFKALGEASNKRLDVTSKERSLAAYYHEGFFLAVTNPKPILFFIAIFPQFLNAESSIAPQFLILTLSFMALSFLSLFSYGYLGKTAKILFSNELRMQWFHRVTGGLFIMMGLGLLKLKNSTM